MFARSMKCLQAGLLVVSIATAAEADFTSIAYWKFDAMNDTSANHNTPVDNFQTIDVTGNGTHLYSWKSGGTQNYTSTAANLPPSTLFAGLNPTSMVNDASAGAILFHEVGFNGNDFNLTEKSFSIEGFFRTDGNQSGAGRMEIVMNGQSQYSYNVNLNQLAQGQLQFAVGDGTTFPAVTLGGGGGHNFADGNWYGFVATYNHQGSGQQNILSLSAYDQSGALVAGSTTLTPVDFNLTGTNTNLAVGVNNNAAFPWANRFVGNLDEIRISRGVVDSKWQLRNVEVYSDTFDNTHDYKASGVAGTMWDGIVNGTGATTTFATANSPMASGDGNLQIGIPNTSSVGFDASFNNAPFLYKNVPAGRDFDVQLVLESVTAGNYSATGLMVRLADSSSDGILGVANQEDLVSLVYHNFAPTRNTFRSVNDGSQSDLNYNSLAVERYLRIVREGDEFTYFTRSFDGADWKLLGSIIRPDLAGEVQVGFWNGYFGGGTTGVAEIENFLLYVAVPEPSGFTLAALGMTALFTMRRRRRG